MSNTIKQFPLLNRTMKGIQNLSDSYSADGEENQKKFVTDLNTVIDTIKENESGGSVDPEQVDEIIDDRIWNELNPDGDLYNKTQIDQKFSDLPTSTWNVVSVQQLPANPSSRTIYLVRGTVVVH